jgi:peptidyl-prolyl cis-trans isomerase C
MGFLVLATMPAFAHGQAAAGKPVSAQAAKPAAAVNGITISTAQVDALINARPQAVALPEAQMKQLRLEALNHLIDDVLLQQFLRKNGPKVDPAEVKKNVSELEGSLKKQGKTLADYYRESGQTADELYQTAQMVLQLSAYIKNRLAEADIRRYYDENRELFDMVKVKASHIVLRVAASASDKDRKEAREKLLAIRQQIISKQISFAEAAKKYSQSESASRGGDIGEFPRKGWVEEPFARAAYGLKVGEISDVVTTEYGLHLIQITNRTKGESSDYSKVHEGVRELCIEEMIQDLIARERKAAKIEVYLQ